MPLYTYKCQTCGGMKDEYNLISDRHKAPLCDCGSATSLSIQPTQIAPVMGGGDFPGYQCPVTDEFISSRRKRKYIMEENNLIDVGDRPPSKKRQEQTENGGVSPKQPETKDVHWEHFS